MIGKKVEVFNLMTYLRETWLSFSVAKVKARDRPKDSSDKINWLSEFDSSFSSGARQIAL